MKTTKELRDERAVIQEQMRDLVNRAKKDGGRNLNEDEAKQFDALDAEMNNLTTQIERAQKIEALNAQKAEPLKEKKEEEKDPAKDYEKTFWEFARKGVRGLSREEQDIMYAFRGTNPQTTTPAQGGYTVPQGFSNELQEEMAHWGGMLANARVYPTESGELIKWPTVDDTGVVGAILTEGTGATVSDMAFGSKDLNAYTYTSYIVKVSRQLLQDSAFPLESYLRRALSRRLGAGMNLHFTTGTGTNQPNGVITASSVGATSASNSALTRSELVDLAHSIDPAYRRNAKWMFNDTTLALIKKLAFGSSDARPLWQLSMRDGEPDRIEGYQYFVNQDTADFGASAKPIAFGDFDEYVIRMVGSPELLRLDERYADELNVAFIAYQRADGELIAGNAIKVLANPA